MRQTIAILGVPIDTLNTAGVMARMEQFVQERRFHQVATANTDFLINAMHDPELRYILCNADLVMPDGMPLVWSARILGTPLPERVTGADIVPALAALAAAKGYRIYMLGARPEVAEAARKRLLLDNPGLQIVGCVSPQVSPLLAMDSEKLVDDIVQAKPDVLMVAFGNPKQEKWIFLHRHRLRNIPICIGVGGTFDFLAGQTNRAPGWMQRTGMEWLYRLAQEPRRLWRRYYNDLVHLTRFLARQLWAMGIGRKEVTGTIENRRIADCTVISITGRLDVNNLEQFQEIANNALTPPSTHLLLEMQNTTQMDGLALGTLVNLTKRAASRGRDVRIVRASPRVRRIVGITMMEESVRVYNSVEEALKGPENSTMQMDLALDGDQAECILRGRADFMHMHEVDSRLNALPKSVREVVIDLRLVTYIDCTMLNILLQFAEEIPERNVRLVPGPAVQTVLVREKVLDRFTLQDSPDTDVAQQTTSVSI